MGVSPWCDILFGQNFLTDTNYYAINHLVCSIRLCYSAIAYIFLNTMHHYESIVPGSGQKEFTLVVARAYKAIA